MSLKLKKESDDLWLCGLEDLRLNEPRTSISHSDLYEGSSRIIKILNKFLFKHIKAWSQKETPGPKLKPMPEEGGIAPTDMGENKPEYQAPLVKALK